MNNFIDNTHALKFSITLSLTTPLLLRSGFDGDFTDSTIEKTPDEMCLHINGYVWASLLRRSMARLKPYQKIASEIGKFEQPEKQGVSPFWFESSFVPLIALDVRPGIKIDRKYGTTTRSALYNDEIVPPGHKLTLNFICFHNENRTEELEKAVRAASWVVNEGIENIGGGWSYGYGRLSVDHIFVKRLNLADDNQRVNLWKDITDSDDKKITIIKPKDGDIDQPWVKYTVTAKVMKGQLLAIHSNHFPHFSETLPEEIQALDHLPDTFVFRRYNVGKNDKVETEFSIPGKAIRQALFSVPIERKLRTKNPPDTICSTPGAYCTCKTCNDYIKSGSKRNSPDCTCQRCAWFGSTKNGGIIAVTDGIFNMDGSNKPETVIINRVQLCEHSMQNIHLFSGEYLKEGKFAFDIWIDCSRIKSDAQELKKEVVLLLEEMKQDCKAPPGWHRLGATSTCTGQIEIVPHDLWHTDGERR